MPELVRSRRAVANRKSRGTRSPASLVNWPLGHVALTLRTAADDALQPSSQGGDQEPDHAQFPRFDASDVICGRGESVCCQACSELIEDPPADFDPARLSKSGQWAEDVDCGRQGHG